MADFAELALEDLLDDDWLAVDASVLSVPQPAASSSSTTQRLTSFLYQQLPTFLKSPEIPSTQDRTSVADLNLSTSLPDLVDPCVRRSFFRWAFRLGIVSTAHCIQDARHFAPLGLVSSNCGGPALAASVTLSSLHASQSEVERVEMAFITQPSVLMERSLNQQLLQEGLISVQMRRELMSLLSTKAQPVHLPCTTVPLPQPLSHCLPCALRAPLWYLLSGARRLRFLIHQRLLERGAHIFPVLSSSQDAPLYSTTSDGRRKPLVQRDLVHLLSSGYYALLCKNLDATSTASDDDIDKDLHRTLPQHPLFYNSWKTPAAMHTQPARVAPSSTSTTNTSTSEFSAPSADMPRFSSSSAAAAAASNSQTTLLPELRWRTDGQLRLRRLLRAFASHFPHIGYTQGLNRIAAMILAAQLHPQPYTVPIDTQEWCDDDVEPGTVPISSIGPQCDDIHADRGEEMTFYLLVTLIGPRWSLYAGPQQSSLITQSLFGVEIEMRCLFGILEQETLHPDGQIAKLISETGDPISGRPPIIEPTSADAGQSSISLPTSPSAVEGHHLLRKCRELQCDVLALTVAWLLCFGCDAPLPTSTVSNESEPRAAASSTCFRLFDVVLTSVKSLSSIDASMLNSDRLPQGLLNRSSSTSTLQSLIEQTMQRVDTQCALRPSTAPLSPPPQSIINISSNKNRSPSVSLPHRSHQLQRLSIVAATVATSSATAAASAPPSTMASPNALQLLRTASKWSCCAPCVHQISSLCTPLQLAPESPQPVSPSISAPLGFVWSALAAVSNSITGSESTPAPSVGQTATSPSDAIGVAHQQYQSVAGNALLSDLELDRCDWQHRFTITLLEASVRLSVSLSPSLDVAYVYRELLPLICHPMLAASHLKSSPLRNQLESWR